MAAARRRFARFRRRRRGDRWLWQQHAKWRLRRAGVLRALTEFNDLRPPNAFAPNYTDLSLLHRMVRKHRPRVILEFGGGCSSLVLAHAAAEVGGRVYSVDSDPYWAEATRRALPVSLAASCDVLYAPAVEAEYADTPGWRHVDVPEVEPDFIYLDGPPLTEDRPVAFDVLDLEPRFRPGFLMMVDGRRENALFLRRHFRRRYRVTELREVYGFVFELEDEAPGSRQSSG